MSLEEKAIDVASKSVEAIKKMPIPVVFFFASIAILMVYWFLSIFLFHHIFYKANTIWITIIFSFAFSLLWFLTSMFSSLLIIVKKYPSTDEYENSIKIIFVGGYSAIIHLSGIMAITFILKHFFQISFNTFLIFCTVHASYRFLAAIFFKRNNIVNKSDDSHKDEN